MSKYVSNRQKTLDLGISNYTESSNVLNIIGNTNISGIVTASVGAAVTYYGDGSALTALNGSQITSGTIPGDRGVTSGSTSSSFIEYNGLTKTAGQFDGGTTDPSNSIRLNYDGHFYATKFYGDGSGLTGITTLGFFSDNQVISQDANLKHNETYYSIHKNIIIEPGNTLTIGSGSTVVLDRFNNLDDVKVDSLISVGAITAPVFSGTATYATLSGIATYANSAGVSTNSDYATYAASAGIATNATNADYATYAATAGIATDATNANYATYAGTAGIATNATTAANADVATYASNAGISTNVIGGISSVTSSITGSLSVIGISTLGFFSDNQVISQDANLKHNETYYSIHKNIIIEPGNTLTIGSGSTVVLDRFNNLDDVSAKSLISVGVITAPVFSGTATYATLSGIATYATYASNAGIATYATYASNAGISTNVIGGIVSATNLNVSGITTLGFFTADTQVVSENLTLNNNTTYYNLNKTLVVPTGVTFSVGSGSTVVLDRFNNLDDVKVDSLISVGVITATDFSTTSDINLKENISVIEKPIEKVMSINGVHFTWRKNQKPSMGVIAQEIEKVLPELVSDTHIGKTVNYNGIIGLLVEVVKEQQKQIDDLKKY